MVEWGCLSKSEQKQSSQKMGESNDGEVWCRSRNKTKSNARLKPMEKKSSQPAASKQKPKHERKWITGGKGQSMRWKA